MNKNRKIVLIVSFIILLIVGIIIYCYWFFPTTIEIPNNQIDENSNQIILTNSKLLWDTGADGTIFFKDFNQRKIIIGLANVSDFHKKSTIRKRYFSITLIADSILFKNLVYNEISIDNISQGVQYLAINGILGMNVINKYNWIIDFDKNTLQNLSKTTTYNHTPQFTLRYSNAMKPKTAVSIADVKLKNILIDSGFNIDFTLLSSDIEQINQCIAPDTIFNTSSSGLFSDSIVESKYQYSNIMIDNIKFDKLYITEGNRRLIGTGFFRKFDRVFWDSKNREVRFYKD